LPKVHRNESASSAAQCLPIGIPIIGWSTNQPNSTNMLSIKKY
jgi:hypothetical protein